MDECALSIGRDSCHMLTECHWCGLDESLQHGLLRHPAFRVHYDKHKSERMETNRRSFPETGPLGAALLAGAGASRVRRTRR